MKIRIASFLVFLIVISFITGCGNDSSFYSEEYYSTVFSTDSTDVEISSDPKEDVLSVYKTTEEQFKNSCVDIVYNDLDSSWNNKWITKELLFDYSENREYLCCATEDLIEEQDGYQRIYKVYKIFDRRFDKSFPIQSNDVIRIYGIVTDINMNYANGLNYPIIDMYYADYIREWKKPADNTKTVEELIAEREAESERIEAENKYYNSINSDYTGQTKNTDNMEFLSEEDFKEKCDQMNFKNMVDSTEDLSGRNIKIHVKLTSHEVFAFEEAKKKHLGDLADKYSINDNVWYGRLYYERTQKYIGDPILLYFADNNTYNIDDLKKDQELTVYGTVLNYKINDGFHNEFDFLVIYIE